MITPYLVEVSSLSITFKINLVLVYRRFFRIFANKPYLMLSLSTFGMMYSVFIISSADILNISH